MRQVYNGLWPPYASHVLIELWEKKEEAGVKEKGLSGRGTEAFEGERHFVRVLYNGEVVTQHVEACQPYFTQGSSLAASRPKTRGGASGRVRGSENNREPKRFGVQEDVSGARTELCPLSLFSLIPQTLYAPYDSYQDACNDASALLEE